MPNVWTSAQVLEPPRLLGYQLQPFAAHHLLSLMHLDSPLVTGKPAGAIDVITACLVCYDDYDHRMQTYVRFAFSWWRKALMLWRMRGGRGAAAGKKLVEYLAAGMKMPELFSDRSTRHDPVPFPVRIVAVLMRKYRMTYAAAMDFPLRQGLPLIALACEENGAEIVDEDLMMSAIAAMQGASNA